jgi:acetyl-CoA synthetase
MRRLLTQLFEGTALGDTTSLQNEPAIAGIQDALRRRATAAPGNPNSGQK